MKVISGILKGRNIEGFYLKGTRPTMDRVKESLFAMLQEDMKESIILDLFAGSGNLGIEAISEGASFAYLNDAARQATKVIKRNITTFAIEDQVEVMNLDFKKALLSLADKKITFGLIFLDPPYNTPYIKEALSLIEEYHLLNNDGKVICETDHLEKIPLNTKMSIEKSKKYGDKYIVILKQI